MKKSAKILFLTIIVVLLFALVACGEENTPNAGEVDCTDGHDFVEWTVVSEATCFADGYKIRICKRCSEIDKEKITSNGHSFTDGACDKCGIQETVTSTEQQGTQGLWYMLSADKESYIVAGLGMSESCTEVVIASEYKGKPVTAIRESAFQNCIELLSIEIPDSVTSIGVGAFYNCSGLTSIEIPNGVTSIGVCAFQGCSGLTSVAIGSGVTSIGNSAFYGCRGLTSIDIPSSVTSIGGAAFSGCSGLTSIDIPDGVTSIGSSVFSGCSGLTSIEIPNGVTSIGAGAFEYCSGLTSIEIPNGVTSIGDGAFSGCSGLTSIEIPSSVTSIGRYLFIDCSSLKIITIQAVTGDIINIISGLKNCNALTKIDWNTITVEDGKTIVGYLYYYDNNIGNFILYCADGSVAKDGTVTYYED